MNKKSIVEEDDSELREQLQMLVNKIKGNDYKLISSSLEMLKFIIRTSTTSMTSVPKPLKYLAPYYNAFKESYENMMDAKCKKQCADIISVLAMGPTGGDIAKEQHDCLHYCLKGTDANVGNWGHEYVRQLEAEIVEEWPFLCSVPSNLMLLIKEIIKFDCEHHAEIQACDLLMEIDKLEMLFEHIDNSIYPRICLYLGSCIKYVEESEANKILNLVVQLYIKFGESIKAIIIAMQLNDIKLANKIFSDCKDIIVLRQMAFIAARQLFPIELDPDMEDYDELLNILSNSYLSTHFLTFTRELDIMEPKTPDDVYKTWLEPTPLRPTVLGENMDSAPQNLAASFVNGFINAGFGKDKLITTEKGNKWIYRNKDRGMMSAIATLGLLHLWDVDGGLTPIDKYLYTSEENIKAGALLAIGVVNCRVKNDFDPALALLRDFFTNKHDILQIGAIYGLGLAYAGTNRENVLQLLIPTIDSAKGAENLATSCLSCGLVAVGSCNADITSAILSKLLDSRDSEILKSPYIRLVVLGLGLCYLGSKEAIEATKAALEIFEEPFKTTSQCIIEMCAYAGTGDVLVVQKLLQILGEHIVIPGSDNKTSKPSPVDKRKNKYEWDAGVAQAAATLAVAAVSVGEDIGMEMCQRILGNMGRYGDLPVRRAVPLAIALTSVSQPHMPLVDVLTKYAHDGDDEVSCNAIFCLGIIGAGTNNARLSANLRQLAVYHARNPGQLFMVRLAQGLTHLGKGTLTLSPLHTGRQLLDPCAMAGILIALVSLMDTRSLILGRSHYLLFALATAMHPRWLLALDDNLQPLSVTVRVGQAVDTVGKAGMPKTIAGIRTHSTPVLLAAGERAELATEEYEHLSPALDGVCILKKKCFV